MTGTGNIHAFKLVGRTPSVLRFFTLALLAALSIFSAGQGPAQGPPGAPLAIPASRQAKNIAVITIKEEIDDTTLRSFVRRLRLAERAGADAIVVELDTPGGEILSTIGICDAIKASAIKNSAAWINRSAYSGGAIVALACREIVYNDPAAMGSAAPVGVSLFGMVNKLPEEIRQKFLALIIAELVDSARRNGYDEMLVQGIASLGVELWMVENKETHQRVCINRAEYQLIFGEDPPVTTPQIYSAPTIPDSTKGFELPGWTGRANKRRVREAGAPTTIERPYDPNDPKNFIPAAPEMKELSNAVTDSQELSSARVRLSEADRGKWKVLEYITDGKGLLVFKSDAMKRYGFGNTVVHDDKELLQHFGAKNILRLDRSWSEGLVSILTWFPVRGLLVVIFLIALFIEITHPGLIAPGGVAAAALVALIAPPLLINMANWWEIAAILSGIVLLALEVFVLPGFGVAGVLGLLLLFGGLVGTFVPQGTFFPDSARGRSDLLYGLATMIMAFATSGVGMYFLAKNFKSLPLFSKLVLKDPGTIEDGPQDMLAAMSTTTGPVKKGALGVAMTPLRPAGRVELPGGRIIDAVADMGFIAAGAKVRITSVSDFRIGVERADA